MEFSLKDMDMMHHIRISTNVLARLSKGEPILMDSMERIGAVLNCNIGDVMECIPDDSNGEKDI